MREVARGNTVTYTGTIRRVSDDALADPDGDRPVIFRYRIGSDDEVEIPDEDVTRVSEGVYQFSLTVFDPGVYFISLEGLWANGDRVFKETDRNDDENGAFKVRRTKTNPSDV